MSVLGTVLGVYGMLGSLLLVAILLAVLEIGWVHTKFFEGKTAEYILMGLPFLLCGALSAFAESLLTKGMSSVRGFLLYGVVLTALNSAAALAIGLLFSRNETKRLFLRVSGLIKRFTKS